MLRRCLVGCEESGEVRDALAATGYWDEVWSADLLPTEKPAICTLTDSGMRVTVTSDREQPGNGYHYLGDVRDLFDWNHPVNRARQAGAYNRFWSHGELPGDAWNLWDLVVAFPPPRDHMTQAGARYWREKDATRGGDGRMQQGRAFFMEMVNAPADYVAVENPPGILTAPKHHGFYRRPDQVIRPYMFGDPLDKKICLWLKGLPLLEADNWVEPLAKVATGGGSYRAAKARGEQPNNGWEDRRGRAFRKIERSRTSPEVARVMAQQWTRFIREQEKR